MYPVVQFLDHMIDLLLIFFRNIHTIFHSDACFLVSVLKQYLAQSRSTINIYRMKKSFFFWKDTLFLSSLLTLYLVVTRGKDISGLQNMKIWQSVTDRWLQNRRGRGSGEDYVFGYTVPLLRRVGQEWGRNSSNSALILHLVLWAHCCLIFYFILNKLDIYIIK